MTQEPNDEQIEALLVEDGRRWAAEFADPPPPRSPEFHHRPSGWWSSGWIGPAAIGGALIAAAAVTLVILTNRGQSDRLAAGPVPPSVIASIEPTPPPQAPSHNGSTLKLDRFAEIRQAFLGAGGRALTVYVGQDSGTSDCTPVTTVSVQSRDPDAVTLVAVDWVPSLPAETTPCPLKIYGPYERVIELSEPLGNRRLVDRLTGKDIMVVDTSHLTQPVGLAAGMWGLGCDTTADPPEGDGEPRFISRSYHSSEESVLVCWGPPSSGVAEAKDTGRSIDGHAITVDGEGNLHWQQNDDTWVTLRGYGADLGFPQNVLLTIAESFRMP